MTIRDDSWLSEVMGRAVYRVDPSGDPGVVADAVRVHSRGRDAFYFAKADTAAVAALRALGRVGFFVADVNVTYAVDPRQVIGLGGRGVDVGPLRTESRDGVLAAAREAFRFTRFHLDPLISEGTANRVKEEWVRSYADGRRGDHLFVASHEGRGVGFLAALKSADGRQAIIDLVAVHPDAQRAGVARSLIASFARHYGELSELVVGTQVANVPSIRLYESMGFRMKSSQFVLHLHVRDGVPL